MESVSRLVDRFRVMPGVLRLLAAASLIIGVAFAAVPFVPGAHFNLAGHELSHSQLWDTRVAFAILVVGPLMLLVGAGIVVGGAWVRPLLIILPVLQALPFSAVHWLYGAADPLASGALWAMESAVWALVVGVYLFVAAGPRQYFAKTSSSAPRQVQSHG